MQSWWVVLQYWRIAFMNLSLSMLQALETQSWSILFEDFTAVSALLLLCRKYALLSHSCCSGRECSSLVFFSTVSLQTLVKWPTWRHFLHLEV